MNTGATGRKGRVGIDGPPPTFDQMRASRAELKRLNAALVEWQQDLVRTVVRLTKLYMMRDGMWGVEFKGKTVLRQYDNSPEAWAEERSVR